MSGRPAGPPGSRGLAPERTALAWTRTALAFVVAGALLVRLGVEAGLPVLGSLLGGLDVGLAAVLWLGASAAQRRRERSPDGGAVAAPGLVRTAALATVATAVGAIALALAY